MKFYFFSSTSHVSGAQYPMRLSGKYIELQDRRKIIKIILGVTFSPFSSVMQEFQRKLGAESSENLIPDQDPPLTRFSSIVIQGEWYLLHYLVVFCRRYFEDSMWPVSNGFMRFEWSSSTLTNGSQMLVHRPSMCFPHDIPLYF